jgi:predicted TIM-barrel fold metal-dependent hydrolase
MDYEYDSVFGVASRKKLKKKPSQIFRDTDSIWVSCEMGEKSMKHVMDFYGTDRIIYASDFPHEPTEEDMTADVPDFLASNDFSQEEKGKVLYHNARNLYGLN